MIEYPSSDQLSHDLKWVKPVFESVDGFGEVNIWEMSGLIISLGYIDKNGSYVIGSGVMVAPGLCITATHVIEETIGEQGLLYSFLNKQKMRIWRPEDYHAHIGDVVVLPFQEPKVKRSDVALLSCSPFSKHDDSQPLLMSHVEIAIPKIGERLWSVGYHQVENESCPMIAMHISSGLVLNQYPDGRGSHIPGPCVEVAMKTIGGMSGGPVFNSEGHVVGIVSSCLEGLKDNLGPTFVSLIWTSFVSEVHTPWPAEYWPDKIAGLQIGKEIKASQIHGSATQNDNGVITLKLLEQDPDSMMALLSESDVDIENGEAQDLCDLADVAFTEYLEEEGLNSLYTIDSDKFQKSLITSNSSENIKLCKCIDAECWEGIEDLEVKSIQKLESGLLSIDATFNLRGVTIVLELPIHEYEFQRSSFEEKESFYDTKLNDKCALLNHYARPYFRVGLTYDPRSETCSEFSIFVLRIET